MDTFTKPLRVGIALSLTVGIGYAACSLAFWLFPDAAAGFMNALFHGLDFRKLQNGDALFSFSGFAYGVVIMMLWSFCLGTLFGWLFGLSGPSASRRTSAEHPIRHA